MANGGIIGVVNTPTQLAASGVWTLEEQFFARSADIWPPFVPGVVFNSKLWLDAADLSTITEAGGSVSQWNNKGTLGNFVQATGADQPTTGASTLNGLNILDFANDCMTASNTNEWKFLHDGTVWFFVGVVRPNAAARNGIFGNNADSTGNTGVMLVHRGDTSTSTGEMSIFRGVAGTSVVSFTASNVFTQGSFVVSSSLVDPTNGTSANRWQQFRDGGSAITGNTASGSVSTSNPSFALQIGAAGNNQQLFTGSIAELVIVSGADATESNRVLVRDYLNGKWGVY